MIKSKKLQILVEFVVLFVMGLLNMKWKVIQVPGKMADLQANIMTVSTVFAGFSFTVLGIVMGMSSEKIIEKVKETGVMKKRCDIIAKSIIAFVVSSSLSLFFILKLDQSIIMKFLTYFKIELSYAYVKNQLWIIEIGFLIIGIVLFVRAVYEMVLLINIIFNTNSENARKKIDEYKKAENNLRNKIVDNEEQKDIFTRE